ncbi:MAG TPA: Glu/Leu/Phe/Val dehydrogenase [Firmicutes bacterium]|uniref:Glu/Leu/Phe/Val dehydrogenase n=1 Tax=Candidatus Fermentithermobacillus carboniphilus TaxID=3085328 RepID=A0AAT9LED3_9FIRM|nr:MAG: Glu/Leu/Phe/Val dehydrogenase [Candidatus Fermentithermobacillus carboniphilus]HHW17941.1 Glu/Leu/Phe/Val dehydrogenase [Candidatus Fermentithermobacillaceae bacterium]
MQVFDLMDKHGHEQVVFCYDKVSGLKSIIAIHDTTLGPALGGLRMWPYKSEEEALIDVLRLSRGMTYKNSAMGLNLGGGKAVIIGDPRRDKSEELFRAFGKFVNTLGGRYITAEDVGTSTEDMEIIRTETPYVCGLAETSGNPSPVTAFGVYRAMMAAAKEAFGSDNLAGRKVAVQGVGSVGLNLIKRLLEAGATVYAADIFPDKVQKAVELGAKAVPADRIIDQECDIFAPCALGGVINDETIPRLKAKVVCGAANNQLLEERHGKALSQRGILYAPDFIANGGGVINVAEELQPGGYRSERALAKVSKIYDILLKVFKMSREMGIETYEAANALAEERIRKALEQKRMYVPV